jgi:arylsulfatase
MPPPTTAILRGALIRADRSGDGLDAIDARVGRLLALLAEKGVDQQTLIIYTSDNGPWLNFGDHGGSAGHFREGKGTVWDGGVRVPFLARWPGTIKPGTVSDALAANLDVLPTLVEAVGTRKSRLPIDGISFLPLLLGKSDQARESFLYFYGNTLGAVRKGEWKLYLPHDSRTYEGLARGIDGTGGPIKSVKLSLALYNLKTDPGERKDVAAAHPEKVAELRALGEAGRKAIDESKRPAGSIAKPGDKKADR